MQNKFKDKPIVKAPSLQLVDYLVDVVVKYSEEFEKQLFEIKSDLPVVYNELKAIDEQ